MNKILLAWTLLGLSVLAWGSPPSALEAYKQGFEAARNHQKTRYQKALQSYGKGPLRPYLDFAWLYYNPKQAQDDEVADFLARHADIPVSRLLRQRWLRQLGKQHAWRRLLRFWRPQPDPELKCYHLRAQWQTRQIEEKTLRKALESLWLTGQNLPKSCDPLLQLQRKHGWLNEDLRWQRFQLAMKARQWSLARWLARTLNQHQRWAQAWLQTHGRLRRLVRSARHWPDSPIVRQILQQELFQLAVSQPAEVRQALQGPLSRFSWPAEQRQALLARTALFAATDALPQARAWLQSALQQENDPVLRRWALRRSLAESDWWAVLRHFEKLTMADRQDNQWLYWKARALEATSQQAPARHLFLLLSRQPTYYGFLAADRLAKPYNLCQQGSGLDLALMQSLLDRPALRRALALRQAGQLHYARMELAVLDRMLTGEEKKQLALILDDEGWHDASIRLLGESPRLYSRRFPLAYLQTVKAQARQQQLPPSLLLAIIRAESAFSPQARSSVGARGLMQLMPAVGRKLARQHRIHPWHNQRLEEPSLNIRLGAAHLADDLRLFQGHPIPAIAAYNAGPDKVKAWLQRPAARDTLIWMENIPFAETRQYLRKVLAYQVIYQWRMRQRSARISSWLRPLNQPFPRDRLLNPGTIPFWCQQALPMPNKANPSP